MDGGSIRKQIRILRMLRVEVRKWRREGVDSVDATCIVCLDRWKRWVGRNVEKKKEIDRVWREENREKKN